MSKESYIAGFTKVAEAYGVDPVALMKIAQKTANGIGPRLGGSTLTSEQALGLMKANAKPLSLWQRIWGGSPSYSGSIDFHRNYTHLDALANQPRAVSEEAARLAAQGKNSVPIPNTGHPLGRTAIDRPFDNHLAKDILGRDSRLFEAAKAQKSIANSRTKSLLPWVKRLGSVLKKVR